MTKMNAEHEHNRMVEPNSADEDDEKKFPNE